MTTPVATAGLVLVLKAVGWSEMGDRSAMTGSTLSSTVMTKTTGVAPVHVQLIRLSPYTASGAPGAGVQVTCSSVLGAMGLEQMGGV